MLQEYAMDDLLFNKVISLSLKAEKALSLGANRVKSPSCLSTSVKPAASIRDKKILQHSGKETVTRLSYKPLIYCNNSTYVPVDAMNWKSRYRKMRLGLYLHCPVLTWSLHVLSESYTWFFVQVLTESSSDEGPHCFLLYCPLSGMHSQCTQPADIII